MRKPSHPKRKLILERNNLTSQPQKLPILLVNNFEPLITQNFSIHAQLHPSKNFNSSMAKREGIDRQILGRPQSRLDPSFKSQSGENKQNRTLSRHISSSKKAFSRMAKDGKNEDLRKKSLRPRIGDLYLELDQLVKEVGLPKKNGRSVIIQQNIYKILLKQVCKNSEHQIKQVIKNIKDIAKGKQRPLQNTQNWAKLQIVQVFHQNFRSKIRPQLKIVQVLDQRFPEIYKNDGKNSSPNIWSITNLFTKFNFLHEEINEKEVHLEKLHSEFQQILDKLKAKEKLLKSYENEISSHVVVLHEVQQAVKNIDDFIHGQPNQILRNQVKSYKLKEQELFDYAFMLQQRTPRFVENIVNQNLMILRQNFNVILKRHIYQDRDQKNISKREMNKFQFEITNSLNSIIEKLRNMIIQKSGMIQEFVSQMRKWASFVIGKREYLAEVNKRFASASVLVQIFLAQFEQKYENMCDKCKLSGKSIIDLKGLYTKMKQAYNEASVFY